VAWHGVYLFVPLALTYSAFNLYFSVSMGRPLYWFMTWTDIMTPIVIGVLTLVFTLLFTLLAVLQNNCSDKTIAQRYDAFLTIRKKAKKSYKSSEKWD